jgi:hypothetical protein
MLCCAVQLQESHWLVCPVFTPVLALRSPCWTVLCCGVLCALQEREAAQRAAEPAARALTAEKH